MPRVGRTLRRTAAAVMLTATLTGLVACAPTTGAQSGAPRASDGVLDVGLPGSLSTLDPAHEAGILNYWVAQITSEGLLGVAPDGKLVPALAKEWHTEDGATWTFTLRDGVKFQDGTPMTMEDVLFSIDVAKDPQKSLSTSVYWPAGVKAAATDDTTLTITLPSPNIAFGWTVSANGGLWVTSKAFYEKAASYGSAKDLILGTGPYKATEFQPDSHATFTRVDTWWGQGGGADTVKVEFFSDESARLLAQQAGELDVSLQVPAAQLAQYEAIAGTTVNTVADRSFVGLTFDAGVKPFDDIHVRRAIAHAIDREGIVSSVLQGRGEVATSIEAPEQLGSEIGVDAATQLIAGIAPLTRDMDKAKAELAASSVPTGFEAELLYPTSIPEMGTAALAIAEDLKALGITLKVTGQPVEQWIATLGTGQYGLSYMSYTPTTGDPGEVTGWLLGATNPARYANKAVVDEVVASLGQTDPKARAAALVKGTTTALDEVAYAPMWWGRSSMALGPGVTPVEPSTYFLMTHWVTALELVG
ncbi:ABC transporter substrate-binding protein [Schaalia sp. 19OD2882]|uniref:ABC transporter substrate-binding protein n=1 Tax=Schaalia sp. 19OD2882 TaxID=2794089 RepID=UPI001C1EFCCC|nr:ABC transporter substrate-binding protein [Schaalia sp. 19OD2882]QWW19054.1 ABC transporter substrate-binding protein [Schaalia sp. 19OD2882]